MKSHEKIKRLPKGMFVGATQIRRSDPEFSNSKRSAAYARAELGVRRLGSNCLEIGSGSSLVKNVYGSAIGVLFLMGVGVSSIMSLTIPRPIPSEVWLVIALLPIFSAAFGYLLYAATRSMRGSHVRLNRETRKIYYVFPYNQQLVTLDWNEVQPVAGYVPIVGAAGYTTRHPLCLVGIDWTQSPPQEVSVSCGNLGWRDQGKSARELWGYMQHFMEGGPEGLPAPPPLPPRMSRKQTFLYGYRQWAAKFREDLSTPKGKRWLLLWAPAKVLWLITIVFPDSIGDYLDYSVPEIQFPKEIDVLCGFESSNRDA